MVFETFFHRTFYGRELWIKLESKFDDVHDLKIGFRVKPQKCVLYIFDFSAPYRIFCEKRSETFTM